MDILMVTPELSPYARATRTADTVAALTKALCQLEHKVTVAVPRYPAFEQGGLLAARRLTPLSLEGGGQVTVLDGQLPAGAKLVLFDAPELFDRDSVYGEPAFPDNPARFALFARAVTALVKQRAEREPFEVVHLHDWPSAAVAPLLAQAGVPVPTVLSLHDGAARGTVAPSQLDVFGLQGVGDACREASGVSVLAAGAARADAITADSPTVAADLAAEARFGALRRVLGERGLVPTGIAGGLDYAIYNPATDVALRSRYDAEDTANKGISKTELLRSRNLEVDTVRPLVVAFVGDGVGAAQLARAGEQLLRNDLTLIVIARDVAAADALAALAKEHPDRVAVERSMDEAVIRRAAAAADLVLLPEAYEPTAALARIAQRYGALPVVRGTGAHVDAVVDADAALETGTGFVFDGDGPDALAAAVSRGLAAHGSQRWAALVRRVMRLDLSADRPARRFVQLYRQLTAPPKHAGA